jgi:hypothetical protein
MPYSQPNGLVIANEDYPSSDEDGVPLTNILLPLIYVSEYVGFGRHAAER